MCAWLDRGEIEWMNYQQQQKVSWNLFSTWFGSNYPTSTENCYSEDRDIRRNLRFCSVVVDMRQICEMWNNSLEIKFDKVRDSESYTLSVFKIVNCSRLPLDNDDDSNLITKIAPNMLNIKCSCRCTTRRERQIWLPSSPPHQFIQYSFRIFESRLFSKQRACNDDWSNRISQRRILICAYNKMITIAIES